MTSQFSVTRSEREREREREREMTETEASMATDGREDDDEHDSKERVLLKYFLKEWELVKSLLDGIAANGGVVDPLDVQKIRSIVCITLILNP